MHARDDNDKGPVKNSCTSQLGNFKEEVGSRIARVIKRRKSQGENMTCLRQNRHFHTIWYHGCTKINTGITESPKTIPR
jgi:hypothetical protein